MSDYMVKTQDIARVHASKALGIELPEIMAVVFSFDGGGHVFKNDRQRIPFTHKQWNGDRLLINNND